MKKILLIFATILAGSFVACSDNRDGSDKEYGTGKMDPDVTVTAPDKSSNVPKTVRTDTSSVYSGQQGTPGSDNPRKNDIGGQQHPMDTTSNKVRK